MSVRRAAILSALWLVGVALAPGEAHAHCGDDCTAPLPYALGPTSEVLAPDGVLIYPVAYGRAAAALPFFTLTVTDAEGAPVDGEIAVDPVFSLIVWRPAAAWTAGARYTATGRVDTAAWATAEYGAPPGACHTSDSSVELTIDAEPLPAPAAPTVLVATEHTIVESDALDALVCCDGAMPYRSFGPGSCPTLDNQDDARCAARRRRGTLTVHHTVDTGGLAPAAAGNLVHRVIGGTPARWTIGGVVLDAPTCVRLEILDVARGVVFVDERCLGDELADQLGDLEADPTQALAAMCAGPAYTCEVAGYERWDDARCATWPDGAPYEVPAPSVVDDEPADAGGGCAIGARAPAGLLAGPWWLLRRRRGARASAGRGGAQP